MLLSGQTIGSYVIEDVAGSGGMGVVYRARDTRLQRLVALKLIAPHLARDVVMRERLNRESTIVAAIDHPNVIPIYEADETPDGALYLASRWVDGRELGEVVAQDGPLALERVVRLVGQVAAALEAAHRVGLVHRDVKPSNALVTRGDHVYLTDFGIARRGSDVTGLTETAQLLGTLDYVSPEQVQGERVDERADVYALGGLLHFALTGREPFPREGHAAKLYAQIAAEPPRPSELRPGLPPALDDVVVRAMAKAPEARQASAGVFEAEMHAALVPEGGTARGAPTRARQSATGSGIAQPAPATRAGAAPGLMGELPAAEAVAPVASPVRSAPPSMPASQGVGPAARSRQEPVAGAPAPQRPKTPRRWARGALVAAAVLAVALVPAALLLGLVQDESAGAQTTSVASSAGSVAVLGDRAWVAVPGSSVVVGVPTDDLQGEPRRLEVDAPVTTLAARGNRLVVGARRRIVDLPAGSSQDARRLGLPSTPRLLAVSPGTTWVVPAGDGRELLRIRGDRAARRRSAARVSGMTTGAGRLWLAYGETGELSRTVADSGRYLGRTRVGGRPTGVAATQDAVWVADPERDIVLRIDPVSGEPVGAPIPVPGDPVAIAADSREVWVVRRGDDAVTKLDARTGRPLDEVGTAAEPVAVALGEDAAWVVGRGGELTRIPR